MMWVVSNPPYIENLMILKYLDRDVNNLWTEVWLWDGGKVMVFQKLLK